MAFSGQLLLLDAVGVVWWGHEAESMVWYGCGMLAIQSLKVESCLVNAPEPATHTGLIPP